MAFEKPLILDSSLSNVSIYFYYILYIYIWAIKKKLRPWNALQFFSFFKGQSFRQYTICSGATMVDIQSFLSKFHTTWDFMKDVRVAYESKVIDNAIPVFLRWRDPSAGNNDLFNIDITFIYAA